VALSPTSHRFTVKDYHRMAEAEIFKPEDHVELLDGEVYEMAPIGSRHAACVRRLSSALSSHVGDRAIVSVQNPIALDGHSEPQPDVALLHPRADFYATEHPQPADVFLAVEVADTSLLFDLERKAPRYLAAGIPEVWVVDLIREVVHVMSPGRTRAATREATIRPEAFPDIVLDVAALLG
jgi:Uma2 family endonuclease